MCLTIAVLAAGCASSAREPERPENAPLPVDDEDAPVLPPASPPPTGWTVHSLESPLLHIAVPPDWQPLSPSDLRAHVAARLPSTTGDIRRQHVLLLDLVDKGSLRFASIGRLTSARAVVLALVVIYDEDSSLDEAVTRIAALMPDPPTSRQQEKIMLAVGPAVRVTTLRNPGGGVPSNGFEYIVRLREGTTLWLVGSSPKGDTEMAPLLETMARSLSR
jgi:hypothetical protein